MNNYPDFEFPMDIIDENAKLTNRNFSGNQIVSQDGRIVNEEGSQTFCYELGNDAEYADEMYHAGWNVQQHQRSEKYPNPSYYIPVSVRWDKIRPVIKKVSRVVGGKEVTLLDEVTVAGLDAPTHIVNAKLKINASHNPYSRKDGTIGIKAYLRAGRFTVEDDDPFAEDDDFDEV